MTTGCCGICNRLTAGRPSGQYSGRRPRPDHPPRPSRTAMPKLSNNGPLAAELKTILLGAFDRQELADLLSDKLSIRLDEEVIKDSEPGQEVTMAVIRYVDRRDRLDDLLEAATAAPKTAGRGQSAARLPSAAAAGDVGEAVRSLADRLHTDPDLKTQAVQFRAHFRTARDEMTLLDRYKKLHDCLHLLDLRLPAARRAVEALPRDRTAAIELRAYLTEFQEAARAARGYATQVVTAAGEPAWIDDLDRAVTDARAALAAGRTAGLADAVAALERVPLAAADVNRALTQAARRVRLDRLADALGTLVRRVDGPGVPADDRALVDKLRAGQAGLETLGPRLTDMTNTHDDWQRVDKALAAAEAAADLLPGAGPNQRVPRWPRVKELLTKLCTRTSGEDEADNPVVLAGQWEAATDPVAAENLFIMVRATARSRFVRVDRELLELCAELSRTTEPLDAILEVM